MRFVKLASIGIVCSLLLAVATAIPVYYGSNEATIYHGWPFAVEEAMKDGVAGPIVVVNNYPENFIGNFLVYFCCITLGLLIFQALYKKRVAK